MKVLVLCVDRDNDLGIKTDFEGPVIGREENIKAAIALGLADPEDADTNTILAAISTYDDLKRKGIDAEVATILGDVDVGYNSDIILTKQLEEAIEATAATNAVLVSNGAEDEFIFPIISSRIKVDSVRSVMVKQERSLESFYYHIIKILKDAKMRKKLFAPIAIGLLVYGTISILPFFTLLISGDTQEAINELSSRAAGTFSFILGVFLLQSAYQIGDLFKHGPRKIRRSLSEGDLTLPFFIFSLFLFIFGILRGYDAANIELDPEYEGVFNQILLFLSGSIYWFAGSFLVFESKNVANSMISREQVPVSFWTIATSIVAVTFLTLGGVHYMMFATNLPYEGTLSSILFEIILGLAIAVIGGYVSHRLSSEVSSYSEGWRR
ncbi:MAG: DUF373 family protein [Thermoplasmata archaeon]|nr:DUF373 family protein [Thermoplasmata archaeon]